MLSIRLKPVETLIFRSDVVAIGAFRCAAGDALFRDSGPCTHHTFVFPRTSTRIRHDGARPFVGGPNAASLYDGATYLEQRRLFEAAGSLEPSYVEERVLLLLGRVLGARPARIRDAVEVVKGRIAADPSANLPLRVLASSAGVSLFRLCREFRASTGTTMTEFKHALRLRTALARLRDGESDLTTLALDLGYSSHSHFTAAFRRHFGVRPSDVRTLRKLH